MKVVSVEKLVSKGAFANSSEWKRISDMAIGAADAVVWPPGSEKFTIYPQSGKKRGEGNGVKPIKNAAMSFLKDSGWEIEYPWPIEHRVKPGRMDAAFQSDEGLVALEWETGNISSSHRSMNKMCLGLITDAIVAGILIVPSRTLYPYLTDRIGNISELEPYFALWKSIPCDEGVLEIIVVEHDEESFDVERIPKGTDGRAKR
jgi:hypothetical protein